MPCCAMLCYAMLCYAMLCYAMLCYAMLCYAMLCYAMLCFIRLHYAVMCYPVLCRIMSSHTTCLQKVCWYMQLPSSPPQVPQAKAAVRFLKEGALQSPSSLLTAKSPSFFRAQMALPGKPFGMRILCPAAVPTALLRAPLTPFAPTCLPLLMPHLLTGMLKSALLLPGHTQL